MWATWRCRDLPGIVGGLGLGKRQQSPGCEEGPQEGGWGTGQHVEGTVLGSSAQRQQLSSAAAAAAGGGIISARRDSPGRVGVGTGLWGGRWKAGQGDSCDRGESRGLSSSRTHNIDLRRGGAMRGRGSMLQASVTGTGLHSVPMLSTLCAEL